MPTTKRHPSYPGVSIISGRHAAMPHNNKIQSSCSRVHSAARSPCSQPSLCAQIQTSSCQTQRAVATRGTEQCPVTMVSPNISQARCACLCRTRCTSMSKIIQIVSFEGEKFWIGRRLTKSYSRSLLHFQRRGRALAHLAISSVTTMPRPRLKYSQTKILPNDSETPGVTMYHANGNSDKYSSTTKHPGSGIF